MSDAELTKKLEEYLKEYGHGYDNKALAFIRDNFLRYYHDFEHIDILSQIYSYISALSDDRDVYKKFMDFINEKYGLNQDILEVASGFFPTLAEKIDIYQQSINKGSITAIDPLLIPTSLGNVKLYKSSFSSNMSLKEYTLVTSMYPCESTVRIIESANAQDKDFSLLTCGCTHFSDYELYYGGYSTVEDWQNYLYRLAKKTSKSDRTIDIDYLSDKEVTTPIISSRKKVKTNS